MSVVYALAHSGLFKAVTVTTHPHSAAAGQFLNTLPDQAGLIVVGEEDLKQVSGPCLVNLYNCLVAEGEPPVKKFDTKLNAVKRTFNLLDTRYRAQEQEPFNPVETAPELNDTDQAATSTEAPEGSTTEEGQMATATKKKAKAKKTKAPKADRKPRAKAPLFETLGTGDKPNADMTCGAYIRSLLMSSGGRTTEVILKKVATHYKDSKARASDVSWNRQKLRAEGKKIPEPKE